MTIRNSKDYKKKTRPIFIYCTTSESYLQDANKHSHSHSDIHIRKE